MATRYIDADLAIKELNEAQIEGDENYKGLGEAKSIIMELPTADVEEVKHEHWVCITKGRLQDIYLCSVCGRQIKSDSIPSMLKVIYPYCHCGAKMDEETKK